VFLVLLEEGTQVKLCDEPIEAAFLVHFSTCALSRAIFIPAIVLFLFVFLETIVIRKVNASMCFTLHNEKAAKLDHV
jgi:hypothetical protein